MVESQPSKLWVAGSNPVIRFITLKGSTPFESLPNTPFESGGKSYGSEHPVVDPVVGMHCWGARRPVYLL